MEQKYNTSFIPKKFLGDNVGGSASGTQFVKRRNVMGPGYYLSVLVFVVTLTVSGGVFAYVKITQQEIGTLTKDLQQKTAGINKEEIETFIRLDKRISGAVEVLNNHVALSQLLTLLEEKTLRGVQYTTLQYGEGDAGVTSFSVSGIAPDFQQVALQVRQFQQNDKLNAPMVTDLAYTEEGDKVEFGIQVGVNPLLVSYGTSLQRSGASVNTPATPAIQAPPPTEPVTTTATTTTP